MKANKEKKRRRRNAGEEKTSNQRVALIELHTLKSLNNKNN
jgi:hypothetical protein